ncbi:MAG: alpha/beta hydrolase [Actinobacteria bacterium]|nr:alpha/beta hydrolase [Actinomycetota bacterium]MCL6104866.1 alpha/beta hydrolase [Actinomycetota bacterium]
MTNIRMIPGATYISSRRLRYAVSDNALDPGQPTDTLWAVNIHGYFAGGGMYWRESARIASILGWKVINPSLPGFGGSDSLPWGKVTMPIMAKEIANLMDVFGVERAVILGHSMGGAIAVSFAAEYPERTLGIIYRDGAATPAWKHRKGLVVSLLSGIAPDVASIADLVAAAALDLPDLAAGRVLSTARSLWPDAKRNVRALGRTIPVGAMMFASDLTNQVKQLAKTGNIPVLPVWGCFDKIATAETAEEFSRLIGQPILWVPGGHSWMLARPSTQADLLRWHPQGYKFVEQLQKRFETTKP